MDETLRVGITAFNTGDHRVARVAWEEAWSSLDDDAPEKRLLCGLRQYADGISHAREGAWSDARRAADSAEDSIAAFDADTRVTLSDVRGYLQQLAVDPEVVERRRPPSLRYGGDALIPTDLPFADAATVAALLASEYDAYETAVVDDAVRYAREELAMPVDDGSPRRTRRRSRGFVTLLFDFAADRDRRPLVYERLRGHVERRRSKESDVSGLFE